MTLEEKFTKIFIEKKWNYNDETVSGRGSSLEFTESVRKNLPKLVEQFEISSILDAPCGDFNWMKEVLPKMNVTYTGGDIVKNLIDNNIEKYQSDKTRFIHLDIVNDNLPESDLLICRDCLFHLHPDNVKKFFVNFSKSNIKFLLTSTHKNNDNFVNVNKMRDGKFNPIDLFISPYNLPKDPLYRFDDHPKNFKENLMSEMILFSKQQILTVFNN
jgi:hypothetical protein